MKFLKTPKIKWNLWKIVIPRPKSRLFHAPDPGFSENLQKYSLRLSLFEHFSLEKRSLKVCYIDFSRGVRIKNGSGHKKRFSIRDFMNSCSQVPFQDIQENR